MDSVQVKRRLVKSPPELWAELSDAQALARRLGEFGEIRITRREPETIVAWEGEHASGTIEIESSGWGTAVIITARPAAPPPAPEPAAEVPGPPAPPAPDPAPPVPPPDPGPPPAPTPDPEPPSPGPPDPGPPPAPEPGPQIEAQPSRESFLSRLFRRATEPGAETVPSPPVRPVEPIPETPPPAAPPAPPVVPEPEPEPEPEPDEPEPLRPPERDDPLTPAASVDAQKVLETVLDELGAAHHRPFSRG
jgi:hypothetical protein